MYINTDDIKQESDQLEELPKKEGVVMLMRVFHESAHHIQKETGLRYASIRQVEGKWIDSTKEDFVDFLTGVFAYSMEKQREISVEDVAAARESLRIIGADVCEPGTRESARPAAGEKSATGHSVGAARVELFDKGYAMAKEKGIGKAFKRAQVEYVDLPGRRPRSTTVRREL